MASSSSSWPITFLAPKRHCAAHPRCADQFQQLCYEIRNGDVCGGNLPGAGRLSCGDPNIAEESGAASRPVYWRL